MPRCKKQRQCRCIGGDRIYKPVGIKLNQIEIMEIEIDEFEAMRLCDLETLSQIEAADMMHISRGTIQRLLESGRKKIIKTFLDNAALRINNKKEL